MPFVDSLAQSFSDLFEEEITITYAVCDGEKAVNRAKTSVQTEIP